MITTGEESTPTFHSYDRLKSIQSNIFSSDDWGQYFQGVPMS